MTRERKAAIKQWQLFRDLIRQDPTLPIAKPLVHYKWNNNCWFCQYVRDNSDDSLRNNQGCECCPLNKWAVNKGLIKSEYDFGCDFNIPTLYAIVCNPKSYLAARLEACDLIIKALKGEHIWEKAE